MVSHKPFYGFHIGFVQAKPRSHLARNLCTNHRMIFIAAFADIMQQKGNVDHLSVQTFFQNRTGNGQFFDQFAALDLGKVPDTLNRVLIHRVAVVHIELHHRNDGLKFGDEG